MVWHLDPHPLRSLGRINGEYAIEVFLGVGLEVEDDNPFVGLQVLMPESDGVLELFLGLS